IFYWVDCLVSTATTLMFAIKWFVYTDHSLPSNASDTLTQEDYDAMFRMEGMVSVTILAILRVVHIYFAIVLSIYYRTLSKTQYSKLAAAVDEDLNYTEA
ncbi:hypothetical protein J3Q64DRAFT_1649080, partial [Phycomyces blakesleeanus]